MLKRDRMLGELLAVIGETLEEDNGCGADLIEGVRAWLRTVTGQEDKATFRPIENAEQRKLSPGARMEAALQICKAEGKITSGRLAKVAGVHPESARMTLAALVRSGTLRRIGERRKTFYRIRT